MVAEIVTENALVCGEPTFLTLFVKKLEEIQGSDDEEIKDKNGDDGPGTGLLD